MKRIVRYFTLFVVFCLFLSTAWVDLTLIRPAQITLPDYVNSIAVIDRTEQPETRQNKIEQIVTGEFLNQDEQAIRQTMEGILTVCNNFGRFNIIRTAYRSISDGTKNTFPSLLSWDEVTNLCLEHKADAILSIEIFDSDFLITNKPVLIEQKNSDGQIIKIPSIKATGVAVINIGMRLYDPKQKAIIDEFQTTERLNFDASGSTLEIAMNGLLDKVEAVKKVSYEVGLVYGNRISPSYYKVRREFYNQPKKNKNLIAGVRKSEVADWEGAIISWEKCVKENDKKASPRAAFNIAVAYEVLGDLEKAKEWAAKAYTEYGEKEANDYYRKLQDRIREEAYVNQQLGHGE